jgi:hypothetical protein
VRQPPARQLLAEQEPAQVLVERGDALVVEGRGGRAEHRHVLPGRAELLAVAHELAADVAAGVLGAAPLELVDRDGVGEVEHVDLLELRRGAELGRHHVQRAVDERHDRGVALADAGRLDDHEVEPGRLEHRDDVGEPFREPALGAAGGHRPEEDVLAGEAVHADPVAEQRAAALAPRGVHGEHGDAELVLLVEPEAAHQLVGERGLAGAAGAGDAEHGHGRGAGRGRGSAGRRPASASVMVRARVAVSPA